MAGTRGLPRIDILAGTALVGLIAAYAICCVSFTRYPEEDAAMLLRYSRHLAQGHGIVWNVGERPVDGATDFLFMLLVALVHRLGLSLEGAARAVDVAAHALAVLGVYAAIRRLYGAPWALALIPAAYLAVGPGLRYAAACYGTPLFALTALGLFWSAQRLADSGPDTLRPRAIVFASAGLLAGLARPEGVFLAVFFLVAVVLYRRGAGTHTILTAFAAIFLTAGLAYFLWRWSYFGHPLPNPFYKKGAGVVHWAVAGKAFRNIVRLSGPFLGVLVLGLLAKKARRAALFALVPTVLFGALWVLISDETNYFMRFRYPILVAELVAWVPVAQRKAEEWGLDRLRARGPRVRAALAAGFALLAAILVFAQHRRLASLEPQKIGLYDLGVALNRYERKAYTLATTEAGLLPLYSEWRAVDAWGLNDAWIARSGGVTEDYLDRHHPELIMFHAYFAPGVREADPAVDTRGLGRPWNEMVATLRRYAESRGYRLAAVYGVDEYETHCYYVRTGFPDSAAIVDLVRSTPYFLSGRQAANLAPPD
jgi:hypothetical protein